MKGYIKLYLFFSSVFLIGASLSAGLYFAYGIRVFPSNALEGGTGFSLLTLTEVAAIMLQPLTATVLGAFTIYSCFVSAASCLYVGTVFGRLTIRYCLSGHNPFTHGAVLIFLVICGAVFVNVSTDAAICRSRMKYLFPDPKDIIKADTASMLVKSFTEAVFITVALSVAVYLLLIYFPV